MGFEKWALPEKPGNFDFFWHQNLGQDLLTIRVVGQLRHQDLLGFQSTHEE